MQRWQGVIAGALMVLAGCGGPAMPSEFVGQWRIHSFKTVGYSVALDSTLLARAQGHMVRNLASDGTFWWALPNLADSLQVDTLRGTWRVEHSELVLLTDRSPMPRRFTIAQADGTVLELKDDEDGRVETWRRD